MRKAAVLITAAFLVSCDKSGQTVQELSKLNKQRDSLTVEVANDVKIIYTDDAILRAKIAAPVMKRFPDKNNPRMEMPKGVKANFFDEFGEIQSSLTARYAMHYEEIKTDELIWDKKKRTVTSDKPVRVRIRNEKIIKAEGFESDETFMNYKLKKVTGIVYLDEEIEPQQPELIE
jgi:hypothetical protein